MGSNSEFLTEDELRELRKEIEGLGQKPVTAPVADDKITEGPCPSSTSSASWRGSS